ncbi:MAG TPA: PGPGW domain-containing protein [Actinomycetota bacterium]
MAETKRIAAWVARNAKRVLITLVGFTLILTGLALIILPGPWTIPLVIGGLALLSLEYAWAKRILAETKQRAKTAREGLWSRIRRNKS